MQMHGVKKEFMESLRKQELNQLIQAKRRKILKSGITEGADAPIDIKEVARG